MARQAGAILAAFFLAGCALGRADWREESYRTTLLLQGAGDGHCSAPAPYPSLRACLIHDAAYELARRIRCEGRPDLEGLATEQARFVADLILAQQMARDGYPEPLVMAYYEAVRVGAWASWHLRCR